MSDEPSISHGPISHGQSGQAQGDLAIIRQALGVHLVLGSGVLVFSMLLLAAALTAASLSLMFDNSWFHIVPFATFMTLFLIGLFFQSRRIADLSHEIKLQATLSITVYFGVLCATSGYVLAAFCGPSIGTARTVALYIASLSYILTLMVILVLNALKNRERYYCLGLAFSVVLAGLLVPICGPHFSFPLAHCIMAVGYLSVVLIQRFQLREASLQNTTA